MRKLKKGDKVVIMCSDSRVKFNPTVATVVTSGKKWVTVQLKGINYPMGIYFDVQNAEDDVMFGGEKDGSYQIYKLYDYPSIEEYEYVSKLNKKKDEVSGEICRLTHTYRHQLSIEVLDGIKHILIQHIEK